jgi:hypothetical protein
MPIIMNLHVMPGVNAKDLAQAPYMDVYELSYKII